MATPSKRKRSDDSEDVIGFLHNISPVKTGQSGAVYFNMVMQTGSNTFYDGVCYCPDKHDAMKKFSQDKTPVKLRDVKKVPSFRTAGCLDIKMDNFSLLDALQDEPSFKVKSPAVTEMMTVKQLKSCAIKPQFVTLELKIHDIDSGTTRTNRFDQLLTVFQATTADTTDEIQLNFWGNCRHVLKPGQSYRFSDLKVKVFHDSVSVTLGNRSEVTEIHNIKAVAKTTQPAQPVKGAVAFVHFALQYHCGSCTQKLSYNERDRLVRCPTCHMAQRSASLKRMYSATLKLENNNTKYSAASEILEEAFSSAGQKIMDAQEAEEYLLSLNTITILPGPHNSISKLYLQEPTSQSSEASKSKSTKN